LRKSIVCAISVQIRLEKLASLGSPSPIPAHVTGEAEVTKGEGRRFEFAVRAREGEKEIGVGAHQRTVIDVAKFTQRMG
jgi:predicted thioesterase